MDWITGEKFVEVADLIFMPKVKAKDDYYLYQNTFNLEKLKDGDIIYTHTMYVKELFSLLNLFSSGNLIVISHNSDVNVDDSFEIPTCVKKWHTTNVNIDNPKVDSIPIGLENNRWFKKENKKERMEWQLKQPSKQKNLVYLNYNTKTNPSIREMTYNVLKNKPWVTTEFGINGKGFSEYINGVYNHPFVVCPEGNGIDTHRLWETLYMGSTPIVLKNTNNDFYRDLPILMVNDWKDITEELLIATYSDMQHKDTIWNMEKLNFEYWKNKILQS